MAKNALNAENLRNELWDTLHKVKSGAMTPGTADAVAAQGREILRTVRTQMQVLKFANESATKDLVSFATNKG